MNELELAQGKEKSTVIKAIEALKHSVTASQVAASTGYPLARTMQLLNQVAADTGGDLVVSQKGEIQYKFARNFQDKYFTDKVKKGLLTAAIVAFEAGFYCLRISFGVLLTLSLLVIVLLFVALIIAALNDSNSDIGLPDVGGFDIGYLGDAFAWNYSPSHQTKLKYLHEEEKKADFFLAVFSFLFGDGDPNSNREEMKWQYIAKLIVEKGGVVVEEDLHPFLDGAGSSVLPVLVRFNGRPEVTDNGGIVYIFEELAQQKPAILEDLAAPGEIDSEQEEFHSAAEARYYDLVIRPQEEAKRRSNSKAEKHAGKRGKAATKKFSIKTIKRPAYFAENIWQFSHFPLSSNLWVFGLASINLWGSWWLYKHIATSNLLHHFSYLIDCLLGYAVIFFILPFCRVVFNWGANMLILERNKKRLAAFNVIDRPHAELRKTIDAGAQMRYQLSLALNKTPGQVAYTTERDNFDQQFEDELRRQGSPDR